MHVVMPYRRNTPRTQPDTSEHLPSNVFSRRSSVLVQDAADHELATTFSRRLRRTDDFRAAAQFMVSRRFHPKTSRTTLRLADVFAARMGRNKDGHFPFSAEATARELGLSKRAVMYHARYLRELGLLAYVEHGSKTNARRTRLGDAWQTGDGYAGTATLFAAVAPPVWDQAMGRRIGGAGYTARPVGVTGPGRRWAVREARHRASVRRTSCTPSPVVPKDHSQVQVVVGKNYTPRKRAASRNTSTATLTSYPRLSPAECARAVTVTQQLQREVWWLHRGCARRLAFALRPLITAGWTSHSLAAELLTWGVPGYLRDPAAFVRHELARRQRIGDLLPHLLAPALEDDQADEDGLRHTEMLRRRHERSDPPWRRYAAILRPELRRHLAGTRLARQTPQPARLDYPLLREREEDFTRFLPVQSCGSDVSPRDIYQVRAYGLPEPTGRRAAGADQGWLACLSDELEAERAFAALRVELDDWERSRQADSAPLGAGSG